MWSMHPPPPLPPRRHTAIYREPDKAGSLLLLRQVGHKEVGTRFVADDVNWGVLRLDMLHSSFLLTRQRQLYLRGVYQADCDWQINAREFDKMQMLWQR